MPTEEEIEAARSPRGGWTRKTLAKWGVGWPPPKGWKRKITTGKRKTDDEEFGLGDLIEDQCE
jgi:hypothetical protein